MKTIFKLIAISMICVGLSSCKKFLDIPMNNTQTPINNVKDLQLLLDNYTAMNTGYPSDGTLSADEYTVTPGHTVMNDAEDRAQYTWDANAVRTLAAPNWQKPYTLTYHANLVLEYVKRFKDAGETDEATANNLRGTALFYRAFSLWQLSQLYMKPYSSSANTDPGVPIRLSPDINDIVGRGTVQQVYDRMLTDLNEAVSLLTPTSTLASRPNKAAAYALLARVYLCMYNYGAALANANSCLAIKSNLLDYADPAISKTSTTPFTRLNSEVIFQAVMNASPLLNPGSETVPIALINPEVVNLYGPNDLRKTIFLKENKTSGVFNGTFRFTGNYEQSNNATQFAGIAVDEVYLMRAEGYARTGKTTEAMVDLNTLLVKRWNTNGGATPYQPITATNADDALSKILIERRKELLMRGSLRWMDLRRLNTDPLYKKDLSRTLTFNSVTKTYILPANDARYTLLIPQEVITYSSIAQNTR